VRRSPPSATAETHPTVDEGLGERGRPEPSLPRRVFVGALALALAAAGIAFAARALRPGSSPKAGASASPSVETSPVPPLTGIPRITAEIPLVDDRRNGGTGGVAVGAGSAWVGIQRGGGFVVRIDLATNEVVAEIPVQETPWRERIAATEDAVWVASHGVLQRIDPDTNTVVAAVDLQGRPISAIAADSTDVWAVAITEPGEGNGEWTGSLVRVDATTNEVVAEIPLGPQVAGYEDEVMVGAGSVWVLGVRWFEEEDAEYGSDLIRVDPATNAIAARIPVGGFNMVMGDGEVWVRFMADGVFDTYGERRLWTRVDVRTNESSQPFELGTDGLKIATPDALWSVYYDEQQNVRVYRVDPQTLEVDARSDPIRSLFTDSVFDAASRTVWVSAIDSVVRLDIVDEDVSMSPSPGSTSSSDASSEASVTTFESSEGWNLVLTTIDPNSSRDLPIVWAANAPFSPDESTYGFPTNTVRDLPADGIVITVVGPREYTADTDLPPATFPLTISQGFCSYDQYETQPAPNVSKCLVDTMVGDELLNVAVWFGTNRPSDDMYEEANAELARLVLPST
jgi:hypothetical protein